MGFKRFQYGEARNSGEGSFKMNNTIGSGGADLKSSSLATTSVRRSVGNIFGAGRLPPESDMHGIMDEEHGYKLNEWSAASESKSISLSASGVEGDTDIEGSSMTLQSIHKESSVK